MSDDYEIPEVMFPMVGDRTFGPDGEFHETACILGGSWWGLAISYKETGDLVVSHALHDTGVLDFVILPVCFLYRHYLELALKSLARDAASLLGEEAPKLNHDLNKQWTLVRRFLDNESEGLESTIQATDALLKEWITYDPGSFSFRYPTKPSGDPSLPTELTHLNIRRIAETIDKIHTLFSGMGDYLGESLDAMSDAMNDAMSDAMNDVMNDAMDDASPDDSH